MVKDRRLKALASMNGGQVRGKKSLDFLLGEEEGAPDGGLLMMEEGAPAASWVTEETMIIE
jgi:hypothetical protein